MKPDRRVDSIVAFTAAMSLLATMQAGAADPTPGPGAARFNPATGHFYEVVMGTWDESEAKGVAKGGHLVTIDDAAEQAWLVATFEMSHTETTPNGVNTVSAYWIGLNDRNVEGQYV